MPDRHSDLPPLPSPLAGARHSRNDRARRMVLLDATVLRLLDDSGWSQASAAAQARVFAPTVQRWLSETQSEELFERLPSLAESFAKQLPPNSPTTTAAFLAAFARSLICRAVDEVALEAQRAGHANIFASLRAYLHSEPSAARLADLGTTLELSEAALAIALSRLRQRLHERIEAALRLWAPSPETRHTLRRQLRQSLIGTESTP